MSASRFLGLILSLFAATAQAEGTRIKDLGRFDGWRENQLIGYGVVTGLSGTGDSLRNRATRQSLANLLGRFDLNLTSDQVQSRNVAIVSVTAVLPPIARIGDKVDVVVTSLGDARSLVGGMLLMAPLKGPDGRTYMLAQGAVSVGGYRYDMNGNLVQKNHTTVGIVPAGGYVEAPVGSALVRSDGTLRFLLDGPDYANAVRVADAINAAYHGTTARALDAGSVEIRIPDESSDAMAGFVSGVEALTIEPDNKARVVINERTGTVVAGGNVRISNVTIAHGDLKVSIVADQLVSQPIFVGGGGAGIRTEVVPRTRISVDESPSEQVTLQNSSTVTELVKALNRIKTSTRDMIAILQGVKAAGALHADLIIQ